MENVYLLDLSDIDYIPEIVYKLSSLLEKEETRNTRIGLKFGNINLNQAQLLSIKSLINGVGSSLCAIDTQSIETEKNAISLGITVSNVLNDNVSEIEHVKETIVEPALPEEKKEDEVVDELEVIFNSKSLSENIFNSGKNTETEVQKTDINTVDVSEKEYTEEDFEIESFPTKYIKQTLRSGQVINYEGNVVIIGDCHTGCEVSASGDITVWGILSGIAHAGFKGNKKASVRALQMNAIQLRIADCYSRRPDALNTIYADKTNSFTPEEARIVNGEIVVYKMNN